MGRALFVWVDKGWFMIALASLQGERRVATGEIAGGLAPVFCLHFPVFPS